MHRVDEYAVEAVEQERRRQPDVVDDQLTSRHAPRQDLLQNRARAGEGVGFGETGLMEERVV